MNKEKFIEGYSIEKEIARIEYLQAAVDKFKTGVRGDLSKIESLESRLQGLLVFDHYDEAEHILVQLIQAMIGDIKRKHCGV